MSSKNNIANRGGQLIITCPECDNELQIIVSATIGRKGKYIKCNKCDFISKYHKGDYNNFKHHWTRGK